MSGDKISSLPINNDSEPKQGDLEVIYNLFNSPKTVQTVKNTVSSFKYSIIAGLLYGIFTLPFITNLVGNYCKGNAIFAKLMMIVAFIIIFFIIQKLFLKS